MRLVSIINVWHDCLCLLPHAIKNHLQFCDDVIVVWSSKSNHGNEDGGKMLEFVTSQNGVLYQQCEPVKGLTPLANETRKRNAGIEYAKAKGFTHFFLADADEFYIPEEVEKAKELFNEPNLNGIVCPLRVFVGKPTLWCGDHTWFRKVVYAVPRIFQTLELRSRILLNCRTQHLNQRIGWRNSRGTQSLRTRTLFCHT